MGDNKRRNHKRSGNWCSQDDVNQKYCSKIKSRAQRRNLTPPSRLVESPLNPSLLPTNTVALNGNTSNNEKESSNVVSGLMITGISIGSLIILTVIIYCLIRFIKKRGSNDDEKVKDEQDEQPPLPLSNPRELTIKFVKHNHPTPELCTTPDTQPILDYYSSKAGLTPFCVDNSLDNNNVHKSTTIEIGENTDISPPSDSNNQGYVPQYYNGMEIPPLGARIIPLERQVQIAKELTSTNLSPTKHKRKSNRSISSLLSINSRRKSNSTSSINNYHNNNNNNNNNNNSSTTNTLSLIHESPKNENSANI